jgi:hypothetical protein
LFSITFLVSYFPFLVVDLASSTEQVSEHTYHSIGDNSDSPLTGGHGIDPVSVEPDPTHPWSREDEDYLDFIFPDSSKHKPYLDTLTRPPISGDEVRFPCVVNDKSWENHNPEEFFANKDNFRASSDPISTSSVATTSKQGFFASLFTKVSSFFHSLVSKPKPDDNSKESISKYQDFVSRHNRVVYNRAISTAHRTPFCTKRNKNDHYKISFEDLVKLNIKPPANHYSWTTTSPSDKALATRKLLSNIFSKISSTKQP